MSVCHCAKEDREWVVTERYANRSAFSGYRWTPSAYSAIRCVTCGRTWRTKAAYVTSLPDGDHFQESARRKP